MKKPAEKIIPVRINADLHQQISHMAERTEHSSQDIMRLAMRIGLADLASAGSDLAELVRTTCQDQGISFQQWAAEKSKPKFTGEKQTSPSKPRVIATENLHDSPPECPPTHAATAISTSTSHQHFPAEPTTPENCHHCSAAAAARSGYRRPLEPQRIDDTPASDGDPQTHDLPQTETQEERLA